MKHKNRYQSTGTNISTGGFILKTLLVLAAILGILSFYGHTPKVLYNEFIKPYTDKFVAAKDKAEQFKNDSAARDAQYQEYIEEI